jgi:hypothetical protein
MSADSWWDRARAVQRREPILAAWPSASRRHWTYDQLQAASALIEQINSHLIKRGYRFRVVRNTNTNDCGGRSFTSGLFFVISLDDGLPVAEDIDLGRFARWALAQ